MVEWGRGDHGFPPEALQLDTEDNDREPLKPYIQANGVLGLEFREIN